MHQRFYLLIEKFPSNYYVKLSFTTIDRNRNIIGLYLFKRRMNKKDENTNNNKNYDRELTVYHVTFNIC